MSRRFDNDAVHICSRHQIRWTHIIHVGNHKTAASLNFLDIAIDLFRNRHIALIARKVKHNKPCRRIPEQMFEQVSDLHQANGSRLEEQEFLFDFGHVHVERHTHNLPHMRRARIAGCMKPYATALRQEIIKDLKGCIDVPAKRSRKSKRVLIVIAVERDLESKTVTVKRKFQKQSMLFPVLDIVTHIEKITHTDRSTCIVDSFHRRGANVQQVLARISQREHGKRANQYTRRIAPLRSLEISAAKRRDATAPEHATVKKRKSVSQIPAGLIHSLAVKAVLETRTKAVQIAAHAKFGNAVVILVSEKRPLGIQSRKPGRVPENAMATIK